MAQPLQHPCRLAAWAARRKIRSVPVPAFATTCRPRLPLSSVHHLQRRSCVSEAALLVSARPSSFRESQEQVALTERQEAFLLERLPRSWSEAEIHSCLQSCGVDLGEDWRDRILLMRSRLGVSIGRALVAFPAHVPHVKQAFPTATTYRPMDRTDVEAFVEQCERFVNLSEDLRRIARSDNFLRVITITEVPSNYGRKDIVHIIKERCGVTVDPKDVVFRFKRCRTHLIQSVRKHVSARDFNLNQCSSGWSRNFALKPQCKLLF